MKEILNKLMDFNIITSLTNGSSGTINFNPNHVSIAVTQFKCMQYPNELKQLQELLNNQKEVEWELTLLR